MQNCKLTALYNKNTQLTININKIKLLKSYNINSKHLYLIYY